MSRLMTLIGIVLAIAGLLLVVLSVASPGIMQVYGATPETGCILLVGGVLAVGLGGVISAIEQNGAGVSVPAMKVEKVMPSPASTPSIASGTGRKDAETGPVTAPATVDATSASKSTPPSVAETISALEQAKSDIKTALGGMDEVTGSSEDSTPATETAQASATGEDGDLYVVEEKIIRGRPSRILSDETVEAETDEGWMRFENLEHLNEYLDSVEEGQA